MLFIDRQTPKDKTNYVLVFVCMFVFLHTVHIICQAKLHYVSSHLLPGQVIIRWVSLITLLCLVWVIVTMFTVLYFIIYILLFCILNESLITVPH